MQGGYATQGQALDPQPAYPNFEEALKAYQGEVAKLQEEKRNLLQEQAQLEADVEALKASKGTAEKELNAFKDTIAKMTEDFRKEATEKEQDLTDKRTALAKDAEKQATELRTERDRQAEERSRLNALSADLRQKEADLEKRRAHIANTEAILAGKIEEADIRLQNIRQKEESTLDLEASLMKKDADLKLVSEQLAAEVERQKLRGAELKKAEEAFSITSADLLDRLSKVEIKEAEIEAFKKTKADFEIARDKLAANKADFEAARDRLAVREMAVAEAEAQNRNWESDLKQREKLLAEKYKEK